MTTEELGRIVILNGTPRSGKSSIVEVIQGTFEEPWMNLGVDVFKGHVAPPGFGPGLGLRPHANRPDFEAVVAPYFLALYGSVAAHARQGLNVVVDVGHHDAYSEPLHLLRKCAAILRGLPAMLVGVRCPIETVMRRRNAGQPGREGVYATSKPGTPIPESVVLWEQEVHSGNEYDMELDTSLLSPTECAEAIRDRLAHGPRSQALENLLATSDPTSE